MTDPEGTVRQHQEGTVRLEGMVNARLEAAFVARADLADLASSVEGAGHGFINITIADERLGRLLAEVAADERLGVAVAEQPERGVVDYSAPNAAKEMHVGHLRSTIIGDAAVRLLE